MTADAVGPSMYARAGPDPSGLPPLASAWTARWAWWCSRSARARLLEAPASEVVWVAGYAPVGMNAVSDVYDTRDVFGMSWAFVHVASTGHGSVTLTCDRPDIDPDDAEHVQTWMAQLWRWLESSSEEPDLSACTVTIAPGPSVTSNGHGADQRQPVHRRPLPALEAHSDAPSAVAQMPSPSSTPGLYASDARGGAGSSLEMAPGTGPGIRVQIQLTYRPAVPTHASDVCAVANAVGARIPVLLASLHRAGVGTATAADKRWVTAAINSAYSGEARGSALPSSVDDVRPSRGSPALTPLPTAWERWSFLQHGAAASITLLLDLPMTPSLGRSTGQRPTSISDTGASGTAASVVISALGSSSDVMRTRVSLSYRPSAEWPGGRARDVWSGLLEPAASGHPRSLERHDPVAAQAGVLVTATVADPARLPSARQAVQDALDPPLRPWLRAAYGSQAAAFGAGLPLGVVLPQHACAPRVMHDG
ncbi:MAG TPA: hypothetical protein VHN80_21390 [Kineosporiaceae bacterium]|nr:hypothetical protein [Kineosporiaceae bacterium]